MDIQSWTWLMWGFPLPSTLVSPLPHVLEFTSGFYVAGHGVPALFNGMALGPIG